MAKPISDIDKAIVVQTFEGEDIGKVQLPDNSLLVGPNMPLFREPDFFLAPNGSYEIWEIDTDTVPAVYLPGTTPEENYQVSPARRVKAKRTVHNLTCPHCKDKQDKQGYQVKAPKGEPDIVCQCGSCHGYLWVQKGAPPSQN